MGWSEIWGRCSICRINVGYDPEGKERPTGGRALPSNIVVTVVSIKGDNIRLAIEASKEIKIYRGEIFDAIAAENKQAAVSNDLLELDMLRGLQIKK